MNIEMVVQDSVTGRIYDISDVVRGKISHTTTLESQPGTLTFEYLKSSDISISEGSLVSFKVDSKGVFFGYVFKITKTDEEDVAITCYDQTRYLKNKDTYVFSNMTASQVFEKLCNDFQLKHRVVNPSSYMVSPRVHDSKTLFEMIEYGVDETLINTGEWFIIYDNFGSVEFISVNSMKTPLFIGNKSILLKYKYDSSIDSDTYNQIKLVKENKKTLQREVYIVKDSSTIQKWGTLQYFEKMDENANPAQIQARAEALLKVKNRPTKTLSLPCLGDLQVRAGSGVIVGIDDIADNQYFLVRKCTHEFEKDYHTMQLDLEVSV